MQRNFVLLPMRDGWHEMGLAPRLSHSVTGVGIDADRCERLRS